MGALKEVHFHEQPVTGVSRPLKNQELDPTSLFEIHIYECRQCTLPESWQQSGMFICLDAAELATDICRSLEYKGRWITSTNRHSRICKQVERVEVPNGFRATWALLRYMRRVSQRPSLDLPTTSDPSSKFLRVSGRAVHISTYREHTR